MKLVWPLFLVGSLLGCDVLDALNPDQPSADLGDVLTAAEAVEQCATESGPLAGTCLESLGGECWFPEGACTESALSSGVALLWDSGDVVTFVPALDDPLSLNITATAADGTVCFVGKSSAGAGGGGTVSLSDGAGAEGMLLSGPTGATALECANTGQVSFSSVEGEILEQCLYGRTAGLCDFQAAGQLMGGSNGAAGGGCDAAVDCPLGTICCPIVGGVGYCSPICL